MPPFIVAAMDEDLSQGRGSDKPKLLDQVRDVIRLKHYSIRTEETYCDWIKRFILAPSFPFTSFSRD